MTACLCPNNPLSSKDGDSQFVRGGLAGCVYTRDFGLIYVNSWCQKKNNTSCIWVMHTHWCILCTPKTADLFTAVHHITKTNPEVYALSAGPDTSRLDWVSGLEHQNGLKQPGAGFYFFVLFPRQDGTGTTSQMFMYHICIFSYESVCTKLWTNFTSNLMLAWCSWAFKFSLTT